MKMTRSQKMLNKLLFRNHFSDNISSKLYEEKTFYPAFIKDLRRAKLEVIIESPYLTQKRLNTMLPVFRKLRKRDINIIVNTKEPDEHDENMKVEALLCVYELQNSGVEVFYTYGLHRKLAIIHQKILWEGSLNILSQNKSIEIMRRVVSRSQFVELEKHINISMLLAISNS